MIAAILCALCMACGGFAADDQVPREASPHPADETTQPSPAVENFRHDAALADVYFIDRSTGWAVGDRGVIWHSNDGGTTWRQQQSGVSCGLNSVFFIDPRRGWAVGGESRPYGNASRGIVLHTDDGGRKWTEVPRLVLPLLTRVKFFDPSHGIAMGHAAAFYPSGVFVTRDGGESWQPMPGDRAGSCLAGDFLDPETGAVAGAAGNFGTIVRRQLVRSPLATPSLHSFHAMQLAAPTGGWLVGDGGVVMTTKDLGHSWQTPPGDLPDAVAEHFDFHAVAVQGPRVWVAGSPGTRAFHSPDGGATWLAATTGQAAPLRALSFIDADNGWAVGDLGTILATHDGGRSWQLQRRGAQRAGLLAMFAAAEDVPLELIADTGAAERYIAAVDILQTSAPDADTEPAVRERSREAMLLAGAATAETAWRFPLPPDDLALTAADMLTALNRANDGRAIEQFESHLVRRLRMWRPDVVVTHPVTSENSEPRAALLASLMMRSIEAAADPARHVELAADVGLPPWQVKKVYALLLGASRGDESIATGQYAPLLGTYLSDFVAPARRLLAAAHTAPPDAYELELLMSQAAGTNNQRGLFGGISLAAESEIRRPPADLPVDDLVDLRRLAARRRHVAELMERSAGNAAWVAQVADLTSELKPDDGAQLLFQLADGYRAKGRLDLAADTYYLLARRYPDHPLVDRALIWLVQFYASSEAGHRAASASPTNIRQTSFDESKIAGPAVGLSRNDRLRRAIQLTDYLKTARPALYAEPLVRFAEVAAQRQLGFTNPAKRYCLTLRQLPETDAWRQCAETEVWLAKPAELPPPKPFGTCRAIQATPLLDAELNEPFWDTADCLRLGDNTNSAELHLAYDSEFLYLAIQAPKVPGGEYRPDNRPRPRDADLTQHDRITLRIDTDRDFGTAFELTIDSRGWTHDACWGDVHWNPDWYVAAASDETSWTIEAAIPLAELVPERPAARHVWAISASRTIPRVGYENWAGEPDADSPAQFGFLIFN
jgi:photosystem II stability/assembly factor-like uncharacterized protein